MTIIIPEVLRLAAAAQRVAYGELSGTAQQALNQLLLGTGASWDAPPLTLAPTGNEPIGEAWEYENGYFESGGAAAFAAQDGHQLVLSFRGSHDATVGGFIADYVNAAINPEVQLNNLRAFFESLISYIRSTSTDEDPSNDVKSIVITGHSLGGELAELFTRYYSSRLIENSLVTTENIHLVTFASPGIPPGSRILDADGDGILSTTALPALPTTLGSKLSLGFTQDHVFNHTGVIFEALAAVGVNLSRGTEDYWAHSLDAAPDFFFQEIGSLNFDEHASSLHYQGWTEVANYQYLDDYLAQGGPSIPRVLSTGTREVSGTLNDSYAAASSQALILGMDGDDAIFGAESSSTSAFFSGGVGSDTLWGGGGSDFLDGGPGSDSIGGGAGHDNLFGGPGTDQLSGDSGNDHLLGDADADNLEGGAGNDTTVGGEGDDRYSIGVGQGSDRIQDSGDGSDTLALSTGSLTYSSSWLSAEGGDLLIRAPNGSGGYDIDIRVAGMGTAAGQVETMEILPGDGHAVTQTVNLVQEWTRLTGGSGHPPTSDDYGGDTATNGVLTIGTPVQGVIETPLDKDWFAVSLVAGKTYELDLGGMDGGGGTLANPFMRVRDALGQSLAFNEDATAETLDSRIVFTAPTTGTYFVSVGGDLLTGGTYTLNSAQLGGPQQNSGQILVNTTTEGSQGGPSIATLANGEYVVAWTSHSDGPAGVYLQRFDASGAKIGLETRVHANEDEDTSAIAPSVAALADGGYVVTWVVSVGPFLQGIQAQRFDGFGNKVGIEVEVNTTYFSEYGQPAVAGLTDGGYVVAWHVANGYDSYDVLARHFDAAGMPVGTEALVDTVTLRNQRAPAIVGLEDGGYLITWMSERTLSGSLTSEHYYAQKFDASGSRVGTEIRINEFGNVHNQPDTDIAALSGGGFVVVWDTGFSAAMRQFDASGNAVGNTTSLQVAGAGHSSDPNVAPLPGGGYVVAWTSQGGVFAQQFDAEGTRVGVVTQFSEEHSGGLDITGLPSGGYVVTWGSSLVDDDTEVYSRVVATPTISIVAADAAKAEGNASTTAFTFSVTRAGSTLGSTTVDYVVNGSGPNPATGGDFFGGALPTGTLTFGPGETSKVLTILVAGDTASEAQETFSVTLSNVSVGAAIAAGVAQGTINNDDASGVSLVGTPGPDALNGGAGSDTLAGLGGSDTLGGGANNDSLSGGEGLDVLSGDAGDDTIDGGAGFDYAQYFGATGSVGVDLASGSAGGDGVGLDTLLNIEGVQGGSFADTIGGDSNSNYLGGGDGDDLLSGEGGDDNLEGGAGNDRLDGGAGNDHAAYYSASGGVSVDLTIAGPQAVGGGQGTDTLISIAHLIGGGFNDRLVGNDERSDLLGLAGNDTLIGAGGDDLLQGTAGNDSLSGGGDNDFLDGGLGDDVVDGGAGSDQAFFFDATGGVTVTLAVTTAQATGGAGLDTFISIENLSGTGFNDSFTGDAANNQLEGHNGDDTLAGADGNDNLFGGFGDDSLSGGNHDDSLLADAGNDTLDGGDGSDNIQGGADNDSLSGGAGTDGLTGGLGDDTLDGGAGTDYAHYFDAVSGVTVSLSIAGAQATGGAGVDTLIDVENLSGSEFGDSLTGDVGANILGGRGGNDTLLGGDGDDNLQGDEGNDVADGGSGDDVVSGGNGNDTLAGAEGNDFLSGGTGDNSLSGGSGSDTLAGGDLKDTLAGGDGDDNLQGGSGDDSLEGGDGNDLLGGSAGDDTLAGADGNDSLLGSAGNDFIDGGAGSDTVFFSGARTDYQVTYQSGVVIVTDLRSGSPDGTDTVSGVEFARFSGETIALTPPMNGVPSAVSDTASVNEDASVTIDVLANDTDPDAGDGRFLVSVSATAKGASVSVVDGKIVYVADADLFDLLTTGQVAVDSFTYVMRDTAGATSAGTVEVAVAGVANGATQTGTAGADALAGTALDEKLDGVGGNDTLVAAAGADTVVGGAGNDSLDGGSGIDSLSGGDGNDRLLGGAGDDVLTGGRGADVFIFGPDFGHDTIVDFKRVEDDIRLVDAGFADFSDVLAHALQVGANVVITNAAGDSLQLNNVQIANLQSSDFLFA